MSTRPVEIVHPTLTGGHVLPAMLPVPTGATEQRAYIVEIGDTRFGMTAWADFTAKDLARLLCGMEPVTPELPDVDPSAIWLDAPTATNRAARRRQARADRRRA